MGSAHLGVEQIKVWEATRGSPGGGEKTDRVLSKSHRAHSGEEGLKTLEKAVARTYTSRMNSHH